MAIATGHHIAYRFQGLKSCCWLTCIEMLMQWKHGNIYGRNGQAHSRDAQAAYRENNGSHIGLHAQHYGIVDAGLGGTTDLGAWRNAIRDGGPILAEGKFGSTTLGVGMHVIVINGISNSNKLCFVNPNACGVNWGHVNRWFRSESSRYYYSYMTIDRCVELARTDNHFGGGPFWQAA
ncbi:MAG: papain-like cysteine protease family protein [Polyangiaceae bacterium]